MTVTILKGDCREVLRTLPDESVHCAVTSPPYWGLRDYGVAGQIGLEGSYIDFVKSIVSVFQDVRRVLRGDGTLWLNLGDSYNSGSAFNQARQNGLQGGRGYSEVKPNGWAKHRSIDAGLKPKDLCGIPWRVAFALQADGWWLRQDIIWSKPNPMPESVTDRCTKAHEYLFLLSKSERYYFDQESILEQVTASTISRLSQPSLDDQYGSDRVPGKTNGTMKAVSRSGNKQRKDRHEFGGNPDHPSGQAFGVPWEGSKRNKRSVWTVTTQPFTEAHSATFPPALIEPCIQAGCPKGGTVLDPFGGAGTTGMVADRHGRNAILIELNPEYAAMAERRIRADAGMFADTSSLG